MDARDEGQLVERARGGSRGAQEELVRRHHARVLRLCLSLLQDRAAAEDAAQEVLLKALETLGSFRGGSSFATWLYRIATNHCLDAMRREARRRTDSWDRLLEAEGERLERLLASPRDAEEGLESADLAARVLARLPEEYRLVLTLREMEGLSYQEIVEATGWTLDSVKARLRRARQELQERLRHFSGPGNV